MGQAHLRTVGMTLLCMQGNGVESLSTEGVCERAAARFLDRQVSSHGRSAGIRILSCLGRVSRLVCSLGGRGEAAGVRVAASSGPLLFDLEDGVWRFKMELILRSSFVPATRNLY